MAISDIIHALREQAACTDTPPADAAFMREIADRLVAVPVVTLAEIEAEIDALKALPAPVNLSAAQIGALETLFFRLQIAVSRR